MKTKKPIAIEVLTDPLHWVGWILTTLALFGVFYFLPNSVMQSYIQIVFITLGVIVSVDVIKHMTNLQ